MSVEIDQVRGMSVQERAEARERVAMESPDHLRRWLRESGREWLVLNAVDLVKAIPWPAGVDSLMQIMASYREYRAAKPTGRTEKQVEPTMGIEIEVPIMHGENLEADELDSAIRYLVRQIRKIQPDWSL